MPWLWWCDLLFHQLWWVGMECLAVVVVVLSHILVSRGYLTLKHGYFFKKASCYVHRVGGKKLSEIFLWRLCSFFHYLQLLLFFFCMNNCQPKHSWQEHLPLSFYNIDQEALGDDCSFFWKIFSYSDSAFWLTLSHGNGSGSRKHRQRLFFFSYFLSLWIFFLRGLEGILDSWKYLLDKLTHHLITE